MTINNERKPFCPPHCPDSDNDNTDICLPPNRLDHCSHTRDKKYDKPVDAETVWYQNVWVQCLIEGENEERYIVSGGKSEGFTQINKNSPLIRKKQK